MQPPLLSPPSSSIGSSIGSLLPTPRSTPLKLGSLKESIYINTVDQRITHITRMIANKGVAESYEVSPRSRTSALSKIRLARHD